MLVERQKPKWNTQNSYFGSIKTLVKVFINIFAIL